MLALNTNQSINQPIESLPHTVRVYNPVLQTNKQNPVYPKHFKKMNTGSQN
jgi:hypothetical protein